jgi:hypothetical protein
LGSVTTSPHLSVASCFRWCVSPSSPATPGHLAPRNTTRLANALIPRLADVPVAFASQHVLLTTVPDCAIMDIGNRCPTWSLLRFLPGPKAEDRDGPWPIESGPQASGRMVHQGCRLVLSQLS